MDSATELTVLEWFLIHNKLYIYLSLSCVIIKKLK